MYCVSGTGPSAFHNGDNVTSFITTFGEFITGISGKIGLKLTVSGNVTAFATLAVIFRGTLLTLLGFIPAFTDISKGGSSVSLVLERP